MKCYIGTKMVKAEPAFKVSGEGTESEIYPMSWPLPNDKGNQIWEEGYKVVYPDGYESWSPKEVFEAAYRLTEGMNFGLAIEAAKAGHRIARKGWNGKNQYVELACCISYVNREQESVNVDHKNIGNNAFAFVGTSGVQMGWLASQADMLADDWCIVTPDYDSDECGCLPHGDPDGNH